MFRKYKKHKDKKIYIEKNDPSPPPPLHLKKVLFWSYFATSISWDDLFSYNISRNGPQEDHSPAP